MGDDTFLYMMQKGCCMEKDYEEKNEEGGEVRVISSEIEKENITQHEDLALKVFSQFFLNELLPFFNIEGKSVSIAPTESIYMELKRLYEDFNVVMDDGSWKHFEFQSRDGGIEDLKRFRAYESVVSYKYGVDVTTYVLYSGQIKNPVTEFTEGINTYRVIPIVMQDYNIDNIINELKEKIEKHEEITKEELVPLTLGNLMSGNLSQKERVKETLKIIRSAKNLEKNIIRIMETVVYTMADKFLDEIEMEEIKEVIKMTRLGRIVYEDGRMEGRMEGIKALIETAKILNGTWERIMEIIIEKFSLNKEDAVKYMEMYW